MRYFNEPRISAVQINLIFLRQSNKRFNFDEYLQLKDFTMVLTKEFQRDQIPFFQIYKYTLEEALKRFSSTLQADSKVRQHRLFLCTAKYLRICLDPFMTFKWEEYQPTG